MVLELLGVEVGVEERPIKGYIIYKRVIIKFSYLKAVNFEFYEVYSLAVKNLKTKPQEKWKPLFP